MQIVQDVLERFLHFLRRFTRNLSLYPSYSIHPNKSAEIPEPAGQMHPKSAKFRPDKSEPRYNRVPGG